ncbi:MAG: uracil-DNA glycosylase, partial [Azoarcus sp.]|nr:uracil-DNA glycosylase [Azoarcus sp.]
MKPRRAAILREMGLSPLWRLRAAETESAAPPATPPDTENTKEPSKAAEAPRQRPAPREAPAKPAAAAVPEPAPETAAVSRSVATLDWPALEETIRACRACALCKQREQAVPGVGDRGARWMFVGEGPGAEEDRRGEPFVGQAGKLLDNMLTAIGLERGKDVYIANAVKCR